VRDRLLSAAAKLLARKGYAGTTVREIVDAAGVTKPVLYYHFGSKEGIYLALMASAIKEFDAALDAALAAGGGAREQIARVLGNVLDLILANLDLVRLVHAIYFGPPQGAPFFDFETFHQRLLGVVRDLIARGIAAGEFRAGDPEDMTMAILGAFDICQEMNLHHPELDFDRKRLDRVLDVVFNGLLADQAKERAQ
jgi:AcrR family transcriptional regulator